ncbi:hypothetical protein RJ640_014539 [Escallonia rubra]|uniref:Pectate lyase n=1 Tax=Escallonia rubra TaxID=112253 RepID=A0AA88RJX2_9ASTE|nr:hypothetical protein RJ640_014539 [Escallonia rubra]
MRSCFTNCDTIVLHKVMLLGHSDSYVRDKQMQVTIAYNHFGEGLIQRMPRCRHGYFHVVNNDYTHWEMYAIGGSASLDFTKFFRHVQCIKYLQFYIAQGDDSGEDSYLGGFSNIAFTLQMFHRRAIPKSEKTEEEAKWTDQLDSPQNRSLEKIHRLSPTLKRSSNQALTSLAAVNHSQGKLDVRFQACHVTGIVEHVPFSRLAEARIESAAVLLLHSLTFLPCVAQRRLRLRPWPAGPLPPPDSPALASSLLPTGEVKLIGEIDW